MKQKQPNIIKQILALLFILSMLSIFVIYTLSLRFVSVTTSQLILSLFYGLGVFIQIALILKKVTFSKSMIFILLSSLLAFLPGRHEEVYMLGQHIFTYFFFFTLLVSILHRKHVFPQIDEQTILRIFLIATYFVFESSRYQPDLLQTFFRDILLVLILAMLPFLLVLVLTKAIVGYKMRVTSYIWFIAVSLLIIIFQTSNFGLTIFEIQGSLIKLNLTSMIAAFLSGMVLFPVVANAFYLIDLIPIPGKHQTIKQRIVELKKDLAIMASKYQKNQLAISQSLLIIFVLGGCLLLNYIFAFTTPNIAILLALVISELILYSKLDFVTISKTVLIKAVER